MRHVKESNVFGYWRAVDRKLLSGCACVCVCVCVGVCVCARAPVCVCVCVASITSSLVVSRLLFSRYVPNHP